MTKKKTEEEMKNIKPFDYTYQNNQKVEIHGKLLEAFIEFLNSEVQEERKIFYPEQVDEENLPDIQKTAENEEAKVFLTEKGRYVLNLYLDCMSIFADSIQNGVAVKKEQNKGMSRVD